MRHPVSAVAAALAAGSLVATTQILTTKHDRSLLAAIWIFSFCLPVLVAFGIRSPSKRIVPYSELTPPEIRGFAMFLYVALIDVAGFACIFFHFGKGPGLVFVVACLLALTTAMNRNPRFLSVAAILITYPISLLQIWRAKWEKRMKEKA